ncbi:MAG: RrF2 family transcriptional regulator [Acidimicrobiales bacterium]
MRVTAKVDYAVRASIELAAAEPGVPTKGDNISAAQEIPVKFLENILAELKRHGLVSSRRGADGGYWLARPAASITVADLIRAVEGPLANVRGMQPQEASFTGSAVPLQRMWIALRASMRGVLEHVTLADLVAGQLPPKIDELAASDDAWSPR